MKKGQTGRGITLATLVLALGAAVYMNWNFAKNTPPTVDETQTDAVAVQADAGEELPVDAATDAEDEDAAAVYDPLETTAGEEQADQTVDKNYGEAQLVSVSQDTGEEFFEAARLARSKARDEALEAIKQALKNTSLSEEEKEALTTQLEAQVSNITAESSLESKIKAKGFADCVVVLGDGRADVTVMTESDALSAELVTQIRDVLLTGCKDLTANNITVTEVR